MPYTRPIKVLIIEDSPVAAQLLTYIINSDPQLQIIGCVADGIKALEFLKKETPDVITMDIFMPHMDGFETTRQIMKTKPIPIVIISASYNKEDVYKSFQAISAGAVAILEKPTGFYDPNYSSHAKEITNSIKMVSEVKLVTRQTIFSTPTSASSIKPKGPSIVQESEFKTKIEAVGIGASLGGPQALYMILSKLPTNFPVPIFIVQHISAGFTQGFVDWLRDCTTLKVQQAKHHEVALPGHVYIAPDHYHMEIDKKNLILLNNSPPTEGVRPSVANLFHSMAKTYGPHSVGVILTGMGKDGVEDLLIMRQKGAMTIAQDQEDCLMFGMPQQAILLGAARSVVPLSKIASTLTMLAKINR